MRENHSSDFEESDLAACGTEAKSRRRVSWLGPKTSSGSTGRSWGQEGASPAHCLHSGGFTDYKISLTQIPSLGPLAKNSETARAELLRILEKEGPNLMSFTDPDCCSNPSLLFHSSQGKELYFVRFCQDLDVHQPTLDKSFSAVQPSLLPFRYFHLKNKRT